jgi:hypothetical protein
VSGALPGAVHDKKAEWVWGVLAGLEAAGLVTLAGKGYQGSTYAKIPYKGKNKPQSQKVSGALRGRRGGVKMARAAAGRLAGVAGARWPGRAGLCGFRPSRACARVEDAVVRPPADVVPLWRA